MHCYNMKPVSTYLYMYIYYSYISVISPPKVTWVCLLMMHLHCPLRCLFAVSVPSLIE